MVISVSLGAQSYPILLEAGALAPGRAALVSGAAGAGGD